MGVELNEFLGIRNENEKRIYGFKGEALWSGRRIFFVEFYINENQIKIYNLYIIPMKEEQEQMEKEEAKRNEIEEKLLNILGFLRKAYKEELIEQARKIAENVPSIRLEFLFF